MERLQAGHAPFKLFSVESLSDGASAAQPVLWRDTLYSAVEDGGEPRLVSFPVASAQAPVDVMPRAVVAATGKPPANVTGVSFKYVLNDAGIFWVQLLDESTTNSLTSRYVFHRPL